MTATPLMTKPEAEVFRAAREAAVLELSLMDRDELAAEERRLMAEQGAQRLYGGLGSKDELLPSVLALRGYPPKRLREAVHALYHDVIWPDCRYCTAAAHDSLKGTPVPGSEAEQPAVTGQGPATERVVTGVTA